MLQESRSQVHQVMQWIIKSSENLMVTDLQLVITERKKSAEKDRPYGWVPLDWLNELQSAYTGTDKHPFESIII